jgi:sec-independent protein translocase protein TatA
MLPNLGPAELFIILAIALVVFGPKKLPEIGRGIGSALREFNKARNDLMETINSEMEREEAPAPQHTVPAMAAVADGGPVERKVEYPASLDAEHADALPYGSDFQPEGDSQPSFRTAPADTAAAHPSA